MTSLISVTDKSYRTQSISHQYCWYPYREQSTTSANDKKIIYYLYSLYESSLHLLSCWGQRCYRYPWPFPLSHPTFNPSETLKHCGLWLTNISSIWTFLTTSIHCPLVIAHLDYHNSFLNIFSLLTFVCLEPILTGATRETKGKTDIQQDCTTSNGVYSSWDQVLTVAYKAHHNLVPGTSENSPPLHFLCSFCPRTVAFKYATSMPMSLCMGCVLCMKILTPGICMAGPLAFFILWLRYHLLVYLIFLFKCTTPSYTLYSLSLFCFPS